MSDLVMKSGKYNINKAMRRRRASAKKSRSASKKIRAPRLSRQERAKIFAELLRQVLGSAGMSQADLARRIAAREESRLADTGRGLSNAQRDALFKTIQNQVYSWTDGKVAWPRSPISDDLVMILGVSAEFLQGRDDTKLKDNLVSPNLYKGETSVMPSSLIRHPGLKRGVPLYGIEMRKRDGMLVISSDPVEHIDAPSEITEVRGAYGVIVVRDNMRPVFRPGQIVFVHPHLPPNPEDDVILFFEDGSFDIVRFIARDEVGRVLRVEQFYPGHEIKEIAIDRIRDCHVIVWGKRR
jgi:hypothetical protein